MTTIVFTPDGAGHCLYTDEIQLSRIGRLQIRRATHIEFNEIRQEWSVIDAVTREELFRDPSRQVCLDWEHDNLLPSVN